MEFTWETEQPTKVGWYWIKRNYSISIVEVRNYCGDLCIDNWKIPRDVLWAGPIPEPIIPL